MALYLVKQRDLALPYVIPKQAYNNLYKNKKCGTKLLTTTDIKATIMLKKHQNGHVHV